MSGPLENFKSRFDCIFLASDRKGAPIPEPALVGVKWCKCGVKMWQNHATAKVEKILIPNLVWTILGTYFPLPHNFSFPWNLCKIYVAMNFMEDNDDNRDMYWHENLVYIGAWAFHVRFSLGTFILSNFWLKVQYFEHFCAE